MLAARKSIKPNLKFDWNNRNKTFGEKLHQAIEYLNFRARNCNVVTACETIEKIVSEQQKYRLYQKFFPEEWKRSRASFFKPGYYENYSQRINEFFDLVDKNLFPLLNGWNDDPEMEFDVFYIFSCNLDLCCEEIEYENLRVSYVAGLLFFVQEEEIWDYFSSHYNVNKNDFPAIKERPHENLWKLEKTAETAPYVNLFELVDHSTSNPWLDTVNCCQYGACYSWSEETLTYLAETFKEANNILEQTTLLDDLIEAQPKEILLNLITLWNEGRLTKEGKK